MMESGALFGTRLGVNVPLLNSNDWLRIGWSYIRATDEYVFRIGGDVLGDIGHNTRTNTKFPIRSLFHI